MERGTCVLNPFNSIDPQEHRIGVNYPFILLTELIKRN